MTLGLMIGTIILWAIIGALLLRFVIGGVMDCFKRGRQAPISSWVGMLIAIIVICLLL